MSDMKSPPNIGRIVCRAVARATGLQNIREASVSAPFDDVTLVTVTFIATDEQMRVIGASLGEQIKE